jgi:tetratricopeptide (TPR) repeat protein
MAVLSGCSREAKRNRYLAEGAKDFQSGAYDEARIDYMKVLQIDPTNATAFARLGQIWWEDGAALRAGAPLKKAAELAPTDAENRLRLARVYFAVGQTAEARQEALKVLQQSPAMGDALLFLIEMARTPEEIGAAELAIAKFSNKETASSQLAIANLALRKKDLPAAQKAITQAVALAPKSPEAHQAMGILHLFLKNPKGATEEFKTAAELAPLRSSIRMAYAEYMRQTEGGEAASAFLSSLTAKAPDFLPAWTLLGRIAFSEKRYDQALSDLENVFSRDPENIEGRLLQSDIWLARRETEKAITELEKLDKAFPGLPPVKYRLAQAFLRENKTSQAVAALDQALSSNPNYTEAILLRAELNLRTGQDRTAISALEDLLRKNAGLRPAQFLLADAYRTAGRFDDAANIFHEQIKVTPNAPEPYFFLGLTELQQNKTKEARMSFEKVLELSPDNVLAVEQLVSVDLGAKDFAAAAHRVQGQLEKHPDRATSYILEGRVRLAEGEWKEAELALHKALQLDPNSAPAYEMLVRGYLATNKLPEAVRELETVLAKAPQNQSALMTLATIRETQKDYPEARATYEKLLALNPSFVPALNNLSYLCAEYLNQPDKAYELAQKARTLDPGNAAVADTLGWASYKRGDYSQALTLLEGSAGKLGTNPEIQYHLGMAHYMMGEADAARAAFQKTVAAPDGFPSNTDAQLRLNFLSRMTGDAGNVPNASEIEERLKQDPNDVMARLCLGEIYEKQNAFDRAAMAYEAALTSNPKLAPAALKLAQLYSGPLHSGPKALEFAKKSRDLAPLDPQVAGLLGRIAFDTGNFSWAYSLLQESLHQLADDTALLSDFAWTAYRLGKIEEAHDAMQKLVETNPNAPQAKDARKFLAMLALESKPQDAIAAEAEINQVLTGDPGYLPALIARAVAQAERGQTASALETLKWILRDSPDFALAQKHLAALYLRDPEKNADAYEWATKARKILTEDPELSETLAEINYRKKEYARAIQLLQESARRKPLNAKALFFLGMSQLHSNLEPQGRETLERACAAALEEPLATQARQAIQGLQKQDRGAQP